MRSFTYMDTYLGTNAVGGNITQSEQIEEFIHVKLKGQNLGLCYNYEQLEVNVEAILSRSDQNLK
jgi:hypothetical protein